MALLGVVALNKSFGGLAALSRIDLNLAEGQMAGVIGPNGAGKSTTLKTISGLLKPRQGAVCLNGERIDSLLPFEIVRFSVSRVPEGRRVFARLSVLENPEMGAYCRRNGKISQDMECAFALFSLLAERRAQVAGTLSGAEF